SVDFAEIEKLTFEGDWDSIGAIMARSAWQLERAGADIIVLCTNLIHLVSDAIKEHVSIPFLHIAEATGDAIREKKLKKVLLLGTKFTMEKDFYTNILENQYDLEISIPASDERQRIHDIIYTELVKGVCTTTSREHSIEIIKNSYSKGIEGVILGCTELSLLLSEQDIKIPIFHTAKIHAYKAVEWACEHSTITKN
ncbi:amino acid racemase, partial [Aquimarina algiphila]